MELGWLICLQKVFSGPKSGQEKRRYLWCQIAATIICFWLAPTTDSCRLNELQFNRASGSVQRRNLRSAKSLVSPSPNACRSATSACQLNHRELQNATVNWSYVCFEKRLKAGNKVVLLIETIHALCFICHTKSLVLHQVKQNPQHVLLTCTSLTEWWSGDTHLFFE